MGLTRVKQNILAVLQRLAQAYHAVEQYFTSGSFGVKFYPFLMHPCVRRSHALLIRLIAVISAFIGLYYFFAELVAVLFSQGTKVYLNHSTLELLLPIGTLVDTQTSQLSPLSYMMRVAFMLQGIFFVWIYLLGISQITAPKYRLIGTVSALCFSLGATLIASSQGGKYVEGGLHNLGASITFIFGHLTLLATGLGIVSPHFYRLKRYAILASICGMSAILATIFIPTAYFALLERFSIYTILIWEIAVSFAILKQVK